MDHRQSGHARNGVDNWFDRVYISTDSSLDTYDQLVGTFRRQGRLAPGQQYVAQSEIRLPDNIQGPFHLLVYVDSPFNATPFVTLPYPLEQGPAASGDQVTGKDSSGSSAMNTTT